MTAEQIIAGLIMYIDSGIQLVNKEKELAADPYLLRYLQGRKDSLTNLKETIKYLQEVNEND